jgi:hypothetical protein
MNEESIQKKEQDEDGLSDNELIEKAEHEAAEERLLVAARLLGKVKNQQLLLDSHKNVIRKAKILQNVIDEHLKPPEEGWNKQGESHGARDTIIYYKVEEYSKLTCRIETPIESSLVVPMLSVFEESDLYEEWMPKWNFPFKMGVRQSKKLKEQPGRGAQVIQVTVDMPYPLSDREIVFDTFAVDSIEEQHLIAMKGMSLDVGAEDGVVEPPESGIKRMDFEAGFVFRKCPEDHPCLKNSKHRYPDGEHLLLLSLTQYANAHLNYVPQSLINFGTRTALG